MLHRHCFYLLFLTIASACSNKQPVDYVDPFIGTGFHGHTYPGATAPFGAVQLSPDTRQGNWDACSGYHYSDSSIIGFSHTHLSGTGCIDLGDILFHPYRADEKKGETPLYMPASFSHHNEEASAGYYRVRLDNGIQAELTATTHVGIHRYTFPDGTSAGLVVDLAHLLDAERLDDAEIGTSGDELYGMRCTSGWTKNQHVYFVARFSEPFESKFYQNGNEVKEAKTLRGGKIQAALEFCNASTNTIIVNVGISSVSIENARKNLNHEVADFDFDQVRSKTRENWNKALSTYLVETPSKDHLTNFYTAVYHTMVTPNLISDVNGDYRAADMTIANAGSNKIYSTLSLWDTFRAWNPLLTLTDTVLVNDMIRSMLHFYDQTGELPVWSLSSSETGTMIGYHSVSVIYDAFSKNIRGYDVEKAFEAMKTSAEKNNKGTTPYLELGYIPADSKRESVSCLLENAYDDWCIAQMAKELGKTRDYQYFIRRSQLYRNAFNGENGFFQGRLRDGSWEAPFDPAEVGRAYTEATAWQYRFFVPHDVQGMVNLLGGEKLFVDALDSLFLTTEKTKGHLSDITGMIGQYAHGNEPSHHMAYLYSYAGQPWKTQQTTRRILEEMYQPTPDGISGNEDCGQMSAWYVLSSLGLYQVCPGSNQFVFTAPFFEKAIIRLANRKQLQIVANDPEKNKYINAVYWNDQPVEDNFITYSRLMEGGVLRFELTHQPNLERGTSPSSFPYSFSPANEVSVPWISSDLSLFEDQTIVNAGILTENARIYYTLDGTEPNEQSLLYTQPFRLDRSATIKLKGYAPHMQPSVVSTYQATKAEMLKSQKLAATENGVKYAYYEGEFKHTHEIATKGKLKKEGVCSLPSLSEAQLPDHFGFIFTGYICAPEDGIYLFSTRSDDGSLFRIGNQTVVDNDGSHAEIRAVGRIALQKGYHPFELLYFEDYEGESLKFNWRIPGSETEELVDGKYLYVR